MRGKNVFIAGGTSGINLGIALAMAREGASLTVIGRNAERAAAAAQRIRGETGADALGISCDVRDYGELEVAMDQTVQAFGPIDVLVSGAAGNFLQPVVGLSANAFKTVIDIDLIGTFNVFRAGYERLRKPGASLLAITAPQAETVMPMQAHACAAKAGVNMLVQCLALEWGAAGVRVNALSPGYVRETEGTARLTAGKPGAVEATIALKRMANVEEIAKVALFACSDAAAYVTGTILRVDGGVTLGSAAADCLKPLARP